MIEWIEKWKSIEIVALVIVKIKAFLEGKLIGKGSLSTVKEYCAQFNCQYTVIEKETVRPVCLAECFERSGEEIQWHPSPEIYLATIPKAHVIGRCGAIWARGKCLLDMAAMDQENRVDYVAYPVCFQYHSKLYFKYKRKGRKIKKGIFLGCIAPFNYYHILVETMSRIPFMEEQIEDKGIPLLIDEIIFSYPQMAEILDKMNRYHRPVIKLSSEELYDVEELIYPSMNTWFPVNVKQGRDNRVKDALISGSALNDLRAGLLPVSGKCKDRRKIYLSRRKRGFVRLLNEEKIEGLFRNAGFEIVYPEDLSFQEQCELFSEAGAVAGVSGAAFANIVFCGKDTLIISIIPREANFYLYATMAYLLGQKFVFLDTKVVNRGENYALSQMELDEGYCRRFLETVINNK